MALFTQVPRVFGAILFGFHLVDLAATTRQAVNFGLTLYHCQGRSILGFVNARHILAAGPGSRGVYNLH